MSGNDQDAAHAGVAGGAGAAGAEDFDAQLASVERFIADVQRGSVPTGEAMRAYRDVHRPAIERLRAQLDDFEALLAGTEGVAGTEGASG